MAMAYYDGEQALVEAPDYVYLSGYREPGRARRLKTVCDALPHGVRVALFMMHDHKGTMFAFWRRRPSRFDRAHVERSWEDVGGESPDSVRHCVLGCATDGLLADDYSQADVDAVRAAGPMLERPDDGRRLRARPAKS